MTMAVKRLMQQIMTHPEGRPLSEVLGDAVTLVGNDKEQVYDVSEEPPDPTLSQVGRQKPMIDQGKLKKRMDGLAHAIGKKIESACE